MSTQHTSTQTKRPAGAKLSAKRERVDATLREALSMHADSRGRWEKLTSAGATDEEIWRALKHEFGEGGSAQTEGGIQFAYADGAGFSSPPKFWINCGTHYTQAKPTLQGAALVARVRKVLSIPQLAPPDAAAGDGVADSDANGDAGSHAVPDEAVLAQTESEQRARFEALKELHAKPRQSKKVRDEIRRLSEWYDDTYTEVADKFGQGAALDLRERVETEYQPDGAPITADGEPAEVSAPDAGGEVIDATLTVEPRVFTKEVEITLNDHDIAEKARKLSHLRIQIEELQAEKKKSDDAYKAKIGGLEEECAELFRSIRQGRETREEDVFERRDYDRKVVEVVRADDFAIVETRPMRPTEYQLPLVSL